MGVVFTAEVLAEVGDSSRFALADSLAAAAGIALRRRTTASSERGSSTARERSGRFVSRTSAG